MTPFTRATLLTDEQRPAVRALLRRPDANESPARRGDLHREEAEAGRTPGRSGPPPRAARPDLQPVRAHSLAGPDLAPQCRARATPRHLRERKAECEVGRLLNAANGEQAGLESGEHRFVTHEELDQR